MSLRTRNNRTRAAGRILLLVLALLIACATQVPPAAFATEETVAREHAAGGLLDGLTRTLGGTLEEIREACGGKSLCVTDSATGKELFSVNGDVPVLPASVAKLFVIDYALTIAKPEDKVYADPLAIGRMKENSSCADLVEGEYTLKELIGGMLIPSGNDAAYVVADYCGGILDSKAKTVDQRIQVFLNGLNEYMKKEGWTHTTIHDPSGYDLEAKTTAREVAEVSERLYKIDWIRDFIGHCTYDAPFPGGYTMEWDNTNWFLWSDSPYYDPNVKGFKTGSLGDDFNLVVVWEHGGRSFVIASLGSVSNEMRYEDILRVMLLIEDHPEFSDPTAAKTIKEKPEEQTAQPTEEQIYNQINDQPEAPTYDQPEAPADDQPEAPADDQPAAPADDQPAAPADDQPEAPADDQPEAPTGDPTEDQAPDQPQDQTKE